MQTISYAHEYRDELQRLLINKHRNLHDRHHRRSTILPSTSHTIQFRDSWAPNHVSWNNSSRHLQSTERINMRAGYLAPALALILIMFARPAYATTYSIPVVGRWPTLQVGLQIPSTPVWAHDVVLNASQVWNRAQVWFTQN